MINECVLANISLFNHVLFILILTNDFFNFIEIINWVFVIKVSIFCCENRIVEKLIGRLLIYVILGYKSILYFKFLIVDFKII